MIIEALNSYYERLAADPKSDVAPAGFSRQRITFCVVLEQDGQLATVKPLTTYEGKRAIARLIVVPGDGARSGSKPKPFTLWDNPLYIFGIPPQGKDEAWAMARFEAFRELHIAHDKAINSPGFSAVCRFLESHTPGKLEIDPAVLGGNYGVFRLRGAKQYIHEEPKFVSWWSKQLETTDEESQSYEAQCIVTGDVEPIAKIHTPKIKGLADKPGAPSEKYLVAVDKSFTAAQSYGKEQNANSPIGQAAAFRYCTALNRLLAPDSLQKFQIGDASTVYWTGAPSEAEGILSFVFEPTRAAEDDNLKLSIEKILAQISRGGYPPELGPKETPFYILGLSPNAARISVRFWLQSSLEELVKRLRQHFADLAIVHGPHEPDHPAMWQLLRETVRDSKDLPPLLAGSTMRSILTGAPYPAMLVSAILRRIQADREVRYLRAAMLKACLNRNSRAGIQPLAQEIEMALNPDRPETAYQLGRFFAELEKSQEDALPGINATIKDRFFGAASATPGSVFPRLIRLNQHHLGKLEKGNRAYRERRIRDIATRIDHFSPNLNLRDQGLFAIGYYHQRQDIFTKKADVAIEQE